MQTIKSYLIGGSRKKMTEVNHREYVGGDWDNIGDWQMKTLKQLPEFDIDKKFLDIACGSLRLGVKLIPYLNHGKYFGIDNNYDVLMAGVNQELGAGNNKSPKFLCNGEFDFSFCGQFDFAWSNSLFSHLNLGDITNCMKQLRKVAHDDSVFYYTFFNGNSSTNPLHSNARKDFRYNIDELRPTAENWNLEFLGAKFHHPRGQHMVRCTPKRL